MECVIFDLDGCLGDDNWRMKWLEEMDLDGYHSRCGHDLPMNKGILERHAGKPKFFITGRPEKFKAITMEWITEELGVKTPSVFMRPNDCKDPTPTFKYKIVKRLLSHGWDIAFAFDDREDVLDAYRLAGVRDDALYILDRNGARPLIVSKQKQTVPEIFAAAIETFNERNGMYGASYIKTAKLMEVLHPEGLNIKTAKEHELAHLWYLLIVKLTRFANTGMTHRDSIHDLAVYAALIESLLED